MMGEREAREGLARLQDYRERLSEIEERQALLSEQQKIVMVSLEQYERARITLERYAGGLKDDEILVPLGGEVFLPGRITDGERALIGVGSDIFIEMDVSRALTRCKDRVKDLRSTIQKIGSGLERLNEEKMRIISEYNALASRFERVVSQTGSGNVSS